VYQSRRTIGYIRPRQLVGYRVVAAFNLQAYEDIDHIRRGIDQRAVEIEKYGFVMLAYAHAAAAVTGRNAGNASCN
jgi:hypothetical protein